MLKHKYSYISFKPKLNCSGIRLCFRSHYYLLNDRLETLTEIRGLGVLFSHNISYVHHIDVLVLKAYVMKGFVKQPFSEAKVLVSVKEVSFICIARSLSR